jgi:iron complex transport system permease protein
MIKPRGRNKIIFLLLAILLVVFFILDIFLGSVIVQFKDVLHAIFASANPDVEAIVLKFRLPKAITALLVGIALSLSGLQMQTVFRNPMAGPYVLGISSGASLGVAFVILGYSSIFSGEITGMAGNWLLVFAAWIGAASVLLIMLLISTKVKDIMTVLIIGLMLSSGISAFVTIMQYFTGEAMLRAYVLWTMGSLGNLTSGQLGVLATSVISGLIIGFISTKMLNALLLGENYARSLGLNITFSRIVVFAGTSILAGSVTAFCGPVGFIGIAVPHIARILFRTSDHRVLIPGTVIAGGSLMLMCDIVSQLPGSEQVLPVNAITSLAGIPVVVWVIMRNRKISGAF